MKPFDYVRPVTTSQAIDLLTTGTARVLAGGTDIIPQLRERRREATALVDLKHIPELVATTRLADGGWRIGAAMSIRALAAIPGLVADLPGLVEAGRLIGSLQIQSRATLGGNLCNAAPSADAVPLLVSLRATAEIAGPGGVRTVEVASLPSGPGRTTLGAGELVTAIIVPRQAPRSAARYQRFTPRREMDIAIAGAGTALELDAEGNIARAGITLASVAPVPLPARRAEAYLAGKAPTSEVLAEAGRIAAGEAAPISDTRGSADYRRHLIGVLTRRTLAACLADIASRDRQA